MTETTKETCIVCGKPAELWFQEDQPICKVCTDTPGLELMLHERSDAINKVGYGFNVAVKKLLELQTAQKEIDRLRELGREWVMNEEEWQDLSADPEAGLRRALDDRDQLHARIDAAIAHPRAVHKRSLEVVMRMISILEGKDWEVVEFIESCEAVLQLTDGEFRLLILRAKPLLGLSHGDMAGMFDCSKPSIGRWLDGATMPAKSARKTVGRTLAAKARENILTVPGTGQVPVPMEEWQTGPVVEYILNRKPGEDCYVRALEKHLDVNPGDVFKVWKLDSGNLILGGTRGWHPARMFEIVSVSTPKH